MNTLGSVAGLLGGVRAPVEAAGLIGGQSATAGGLEGWRAGCESGMDSSVPLVAR